MFIATFSLGDLTATLVACSNKEDFSPSHYVLSFFDGMTKKRVDIQYSGEAQAVNAFAAWIASDEEQNWHKYALDDLRAKLKEQEAEKDFLP